jgi:hypothetical protein
MRNINLLMKGLHPNSKGGDPSTEHQSRDNPLEEFLKVEVIVPVTCQAFCARQKTTPKTLSQKLPYSISCNVFMSFYFSHMVDLLRKAGRSLKKLKDSIFKELCLGLYNCVTSILDQTQFCIRDELRGLAYVL